MLGLAMPGVQNLTSTADWQQLYEGSSALNPDFQPFRRAGEPDVGTQCSQIESALAALRDELSRYQPEVVVIVCPAARSGASGQVSTFRMRLASADIEPPPPPSPEYRDRHVSVGRRLLEDLLKAGFDLAWERAEDWPAPPSLEVCTEALRLTSGTVIPILVNTTDAPMPSAARCIQLGQALRKSLASSDQRVAIVAAGGLSSDELGRWVDEPLDRWFLDRLVGGDMAPLSKLFLFETEALAGRTGELRTWLTVASACTGQARLVGYLPSRQAKTGLAFAVWTDS